MILFRFLLSISDALSVDDVVRREVASDVSRSDVVGDIDSGCAAAGLIDGLLAGVVISLKWLAQPCEAVGMARTPIEPAQAEPMVIGKRGGSVIVADRRRRTEAAGNRRAVWLIS